MVRRGKGSHDRVVLLPASAAEELRAQIDAVERLHRQDPARGLGEVDLPEGLRAKMPQAASRLLWQYLFPASRYCTDPATGGLVRHHIHEIYTHVVERGPLGVISPLDRRAFVAPLQVPHMENVADPGPERQAGSYRVRRR
jgi:hypothetical protein